MKKILLSLPVMLMLMLLTAYGFADAEEEYTPAAPPLPPVPAYNASSVVVMCADTRMVLYGSEYHTPMYPASITKVMTALVVLDHVQDMRERVAFSHHAVFSIPRNSAHISMDVGETLSVNQALYALMLRSANEVAVALAEHVAGCEEEFVRLMNLRAVSLGAYNTNFTNVTGLPGAGHVTTAYDMALIMREAVRHPVFTTIIGEPQFAIAPTERQPLPRYLNTTNEMIRRGPYFDARVVGAKTGWTYAAGNTLVTYATHEGRRLIVTILQSDRSETFRTTARFLDFGFALPFEERVVFVAETYTPIVSVFSYVNGERAEIYRLTLQATNDLSTILPANFDLARLSHSLTVQQNITAPVTEGDELGSLSVYVQNSLLGIVPLMAQSSVAVPVADESTAPAALPHDAENDVPVQYYPYVADYTPLLYGELLSFFRNTENIRAFAIPIAVMFVGLLLAVFVLALRRRRKTRYTYRGHGVLYHYRQ